MRHKEMIRIKHTGIQMGGKYTLIREVKSFTAFIGTTFMGKPYEVIYDDDRIIIVLLEKADEFIKMLAKYTSVMFVYEIIDVDIPVYQLN